VAGQVQGEGRPSAAVHHVVDIMPTILEAAGIQAPDSLNGVPQKR
jgi:arylsulfatase